MAELSWFSGSHNRSRRQPKRLCDGHFSRRLAVLTADAAQHFGQAQVPRELRFLKLVVFSRRQSPAGSRF